MPDTCLNVFYMLLYFPTNMLYFPIFSPTTLHIFSLSQRAMNKAKLNRQINTMVWIELYSSVHVVERIQMNRISPWRVNSGVAGRPDALPHSAVALEPRTETNHPHPVALPHPPLGLNVCKFVPQ